MNHVDITFKDRKGRSKKASTDSLETNENQSQPSSQQTNRHCKIWKSSDREMQLKRKNVLDRHGVQRGWQGMKTSAGCIWKPEENRELPGGVSPPHLDHLTAARVERVPEESGKKLGLESPQRNGVYQSLKVGQRRKTSEF